MDGAADPMALVLFQVLVNALWILIPLVPAILTYLVAPQRPVTAGGPLAGLTIKATGAFAAYLIVLLAAYPLINNQNRVFARVMNKVDERAADRRAWTITGSVIVLDENADPAPINEKVPMEVGLSPNIVTLDQQSREFEIIVPEIDQRIPRITVRYPGFGATSINPGQPGSGQMVTRDIERRVITINSPLLIRRAPCEGLAC